MKERLKELRNALSLTQSEFASRIGTVRSTIAGYELGKRIPSNAVIVSICKEFHANESWLRTGEGNMFLDSPLKEQIKAWVDEILVDQPEAYKLRLAAALAELDEAGWKAIYTLAVKLVGVVTVGDLPKEEAGSDEEDEEERLEREAEMVKQSYIESHRKGGKSSGSSGGDTSTG